jgi:predicted amidohydrolase
MKIALAQTRPLAGDIEHNLKSHLEFVDAAITYNAQLIIFPELSLTAYEPTHAEALAMDHSDYRLKNLQQKSDQGKIIIGAGLPLRNPDGVNISLLLFHPNAPVKIYSKKYLHADEAPFFLPGRDHNEINVGGVKISLAICYEISVDEHREHIRQNGTDIYLASVAKSKSGIHTALATLSETSQQLSCYSLLCNSIGLQDGVECAGRTSVWDDNGKLIEQLDDSHTGLIIFDTVTKATEVFYC